jgi:hypothetical protein
MWKIVANVRWTWEFRSERVDLFSELRNELTNLTKFNKVALYCYSPLCKNALYYFTHQGDSGGTQWVNGKQRGRIIL